MMMKLGMALVCGAVGMAMAGCAQDARGKESGAKGVYTVTRGRLDERVLLTGEIDSVTSVPLAAPRTRQWNVSLRWLEKDGTAVTAGQKVAELDNSAAASELEEKRLALQRAMSEATRQQAENAIATADKEIAVKQHRTALEKAQIDASLPRDVVAEREYQEKQLALEKARVALTQAEDELATQRKSAELSTKVKAIAVETAKREIETVERTLEELILRAPRDGIVVIGTHPWTGRKLVVGDVVFPAVTVAKIPDLSALHVKAALSDVDDGRIAVGMKATCYLDAYPDTPFAGTIREVSPVAREIAGDTLRRQFEVVVDLDTVDQARMAPGMSVKVEVGVKDKGGAESEGLIVPRAAIDFGGDAPRVYLRKGGSATIEIARCAPQACLVKSGVAEGAELKAAREVSAL